MSKELKCGDVMPGCNTVLKGKDEKEVMKRAAEHAKSSHGIQQVSADVEKKARQAIKECSGGTHE